MIDQDALARESTIAAMRQAAPELTFRATAGDDTVEASGRGGAVEWRWESGIGLISRTGTGWVGIPSPPEGCTGFRALFAGSSPRGVRMANATLSALGARGGLAGVSCSIDPRIAADEVWPSLEMRHLVALLATVGVVVHFADEWEESSGLVRFASQAGIPVIEHSRGPLGREGRDVGSVEEWSADAFSDRVIRHTVRERRSTTVPAAILGELEKVRG